MTSEDHVTEAPQTPTLRCPLCTCPEFDQHQARSDSRWGFTSHRMTLLVCRYCSYVLHFYGGNSIFDFD